MLFRGVVQMQHGRSECLSEEFLNLMNHRLSRGGGLIRGGGTDVDEPEPRPLRPQQVAISERSDRRRMGTCGTADPAWQAWRRQAYGDHAGGGERLMYVLSTGCQWRAIPKDLPPKSSVYGYFDLWTYDGTLERIHYALYEQCREREQREASPTAAIIDSQSVKSAEKGGPALIRTATMRARSDNEDVALRSRARSGTFLSTH